MRLGAEEPLFNVADDIHQTIRFAFTKEKNRTHSFRRRVEDFFKEGNSDVQVLIENLSALK